MVRELSPVFPVSFQELCAARLLETMPVLPAGWWKKSKTRTLGEALFGKVYLVQGVSPHPEIFALKVMPKAKVMAGGRGLESPLNELGAARYLQWKQATGCRVPGVAEVYFMAQDEDNFYLATEYCQEGELFAVLKRLGTISGQALQQVMQQVLSSVAVLHDVGIAHRDISIENVLLHADGKTRLIDFGQSLMVHSPEDTNREATVQPSPLGVVSGKKFYRAPEARLTNCVPHSAKKLDVFACGVLLFVLAFGEYPFDPDDYSTMFPAQEMGSDRCHGLKRRLEKKGVTEVSADMLDLVEKLMAPHPEKRLSAKEALSHRWFGEMDASPASSSYDV